MRNWIQLFVAFALIALFGGIARAEDAYYSVPFKDLKTVDGKVPVPDTSARGWNDWSHVMRLQPTVHLESPDAEAYVVQADARFTPYGWTAQDGASNTALVVRASAGADVTGSVCVPKADGTGLTPVKFTIPAGSTDAKSKAAFYNGKKAYYDALLARRLPGAAWFRYQSNLAAGEAGQNPAATTDPSLQPTPMADESETIDLFSGGRAVSENLQLNRELFPRPGGDRSVPIDSIKGIDVREMNWKPLIGKVTPDPDKLATFIPGDQHGVFFPSFAAAMKAFDEADLRGTPIFEQFESSSQDAGTRLRYRRQLCLPETILSRLLGPEAIASMAVTGSDPYLRMGSDVAVLFEPTGKVDLHQLLTASMTRAADEGAGADGKAIKQAGTIAQAGKIDDINYMRWMSPARRICAYLATINGVEVVTNSQVQLQRLAEVQSGKSGALASAPEYTFFRNRYPRTNSDETAFAILPDAAIRRWCSPRWRIGDSRRTKAAAVMADLQARHADEVMAGKLSIASFPGAGAEGGDLTVMPYGVQSMVYGSLDFMTPIAELEIDKVTPNESAMYGRWRDTYQQNWSNYFDPIGASFSVTPGRTAMDVSVLPLIAGSEYQTIMSLSQGVKIGPDSGDRHADLLHLAVAINHDSDTIKQAGGFLGGGGNGLQLDPLGWLGPTVAMYVDDDPIWQKVAAAGDSEKFVEEHLSDLPVVFYLQSSNPFKLTAFLIAIRALADSSAPGTTVWVPVHYGDFVYTKVTPSEQSKGNNAAMKDASVCFAVTGGALILSPNEAALKRAIDRQAARMIAATQPASTQATATTKPTPPWLGENLCAQVDVTAARKALLPLLDSNYQSTVQERAWSNLPILNEWHRRFPDADAVAVQEKLFQSRLLDPAGGLYVWNAKCQTMESTLYGCPEEPKKGPVWPTGFMGISKANFGITFEKDGLRAKVELQWEQAK